MSAPPHLGRGLGPPDPGAFVSPGQGQREDSTCTWLLSGSRPTCHVGGRVGHEGLFGRHVGLGLVVHHVRVGLVALAIVHGEGAGSTTETVTLGTKVFPASKCGLWVVGGGLWVGRQEGVTNKGSSAEDVTLPVACVTEHLIVVLGN